MKSSNVKERYDSYLKASLSINMERGWPSKEQLDLSMPMLDTVTSGTNLCQETDYRSYAGTGGIEPLKELFGEILEVSPDEIYIGGTMSTTIMYDVVNKAVLFGLDGYASWKDVGEISFLCPVPGYEKHFLICEAFGIKMIPVAMDENGPDMDIVEKLAGENESIKGIWCVPLYSNPTGAIYSDDVVRRLASMKTKAGDFRIFWDNAYAVHHLTDEESKIQNIIRECEMAGYPNRAFEFASTSKITFPGGGIGLCASGRENIEWLKKNMILQFKSGDKINQYRHYLFFRNANGLREHMRKICRIIEPKFRIVDQILHEELDGTGLAKWIMPKGGYFVNIELSGISASKVYELCRAAGVRITPAGSTFPYGKDEKDAYIRIAPTYCSAEELKTAMAVFCTSVRMAKEESGRQNDTPITEGEKRGEKNSSFCQ